MSKILEMPGKKICLNVAEKPSVAKGVSKILNKNYKPRKGWSKYNMIFQFDYTVEGEVYAMKFTSVLGHLNSLDFGESWKDWIKTPIESLFTEPVISSISEGSKDVADNIKRESNNIDLLILWLDWDREGEGIAYEVIKLVKQVWKTKFEIRRAHFSAVTPGDVENAMNNLQFPNENLANAVFARQEIDLRIGAIFTRFQSIHFKDILRIDRKDVLSYGPWQFPTLGFVVERYQKIRDFKSQNYWYLELKHMYPDEPNSEVVFTWKRKRIFDKIVCLTLLEKTWESKEAEIVEVKNEKTSKWRPEPMNTVMMNKLWSQKLKISSSETMKLAEKLYNNGYISYPRTETTCFSNKFNLKKLAQNHVDSPDWGEFATKLTEGTMYKGPRKGKQDDKAHPPIHPVKLANREEIPEEKEWKIYWLITRYFLAWLAKDALGKKTYVECKMGGEYFYTSGIIVTEKNWLEVCPYERWTSTPIPDFTKGEKFIPSSLRMEESKTTAPKLLTESDLITLMDKNGIGTDATIHEHIKTIQERNYAIQNKSEFVPTSIGLSLVEMYQSITISLYKPYLRAEMEKRMTEIAEGKITKEEALESTMNEMKKIFKFWNEKKEKMAQNLESHFKKANKDKNGDSHSGTDHDDNDNGGGGGGARAYVASTSAAFNSSQSSKEKFNGYITTKEQFNRTLFGRCNKCKISNMKFRPTKDNRIFITWSGYPGCQNIMSTPNGIERIQILDRFWEKCKKEGRGEVKMFRVELYSDYCNEKFLDLLPHDDNTSGDFWVYDRWDHGFRILIDETSTLAKKPYLFDEGSSNGVPNFYNTKNQNVKPKNNQIKNENASKQSKAKIIRKRWKYCNKSRHGKGNTWPGAKKPK